MYGNTHKHTSMLALASILPLFSGNSKMGWTIAGIACALILTLIITQLVIVHKRKMK